MAGEGTFAYQSEVTVTATTIAGNEFIGWYQDTTLKSTNPSYTFTMPYNALSLTAKFVTQYNVAISSFDETLGTVSGGGAHRYTTSVTITATPTEGNWFKAWYDDSFNEVSTNASYTFTMPEYDVTYYAEFTNVKPVLKGDTYTFGTYPQSKVTDSALLTSLNSASGTLPTSARTIGGSTVYSNNYKESHIRSWLNDNFYNTAFNTEEKARIQTTTVDNSVASTGYFINPYAFANTIDKVFLLSYAEATNAAYGFSANASRQLAPSAYAKAQGVYTNTNGFNSWWLRSPRNSIDYGTRYVSSDGNFVNGIDVSCAYFGVPALWISL